MYFLEASFDMVLNERIDQHGQMSIHNMYFLRLVLIWCDIFQVKLDQQALFGSTFSTYSDRETFWKEY